MAVDDTLAGALRPAAVDFARLSREQKGQFVAACWAGQIYHRFEDPKPSYVAGWDALPEWQREGDSLVRTLQAKDFLAGIRVVDAVAIEAEALDHHPDIDIRWRNLHFTLSTPVSYTHPTPPTTVLADLSPLLRLCE